MFRRGLDNIMGSHFRLSPAISSRKLQALRFIKEYFREWGKSPSLGEIGGSLGVSRKRAFELVQALAVEGSIIVKPGARGIILPEPAEMMMREDLLLQLRAHGFTVVEPLAGMPANDSAWPLTYSGLPLLPELDDIPSIRIKGQDDDDEDGDLQPESTPA
jgi:biotin operon repressor